MDAILKNLFGVFKSLKNALWALGIFACTAVLFIGLIITVFTRYTGEKQNGTWQLGKTNTQSEAAETESVPQTLSYKTAEESSDAGQLYIDGLIFLADSPYIGLRNYNMLTGGSENTQFWGSEEGNIPVASLSTCTIRYPNDGSIVAPGTAAAAAKPRILVMVLGSDGLMSVDKDSFVSNYESLIRSIQTASPSTIIVCCSIPGVVASYSGVDGLTSEACAQANDWLKQVCADTGAYYCDSASKLNDFGGDLLDQYSAANGKTLNSSGLNAFLEYLRTHAVG